MILKLFWSWTTYNWVQRVFHCTVPNECDCRPDVYVISADFWILLLLRNVLIRNTVTGRCQTGTGWHFWGFAETSVWIGHVSAVTSVSPHWVASYVKTTILYIWQCFVSSLNLAGLIFPPLPHTLFAFFFCLPPLSFLFSLFSWSLSFRPRTQHFPTERGAEDRAIVSCYGETGREEEAGWLPGCKLGVYVSVRKKQGTQIRWWQSNCVLCGLTLVRKNRVCWISQRLAPK